MSVRIMSAIFETQFTDLQDAGGHVTNGSTLKLVLLALADSADDAGANAHPGLTRMQIKTTLSRQGILNAYDALIHNGIIEQVGISNLGTGNYVILLENLRACFGVASADTVNPVATGWQSSIPVVNPVATGWQSSVPVVNPVATGWQSGVPVVNPITGVVNPIAELVNPVDLNHPLTTLKPSNEGVNAQILEKFDLVTQMPKFKSLPCEFLSLSLRAPSCPFVVKSVSPLTSSPLTDYSTLITVLQPKRRHVAIGNVGDMSHRHHSPLPSTIPIRTAVPIPISTKGKYSNRGSNPTFTRENLFEPPFPSRTPPANHHLPFTTHYSLTPIHQ